MTDAPIAKRRRKKKPKPLSMFLTTGRPVLVKRLACAIAFNELERSEQNDFERRAEILIELLREVRP